MLEELVSKPEDFMAGNWGRYPWLSRSGELASRRQLLPEVLQLLDSQAPRPPYFGVIRSGGGPASPDTWTERTSGGQAVTGKLRWSGVQAELRRGSTLLFYDVQDQCAGVRAVCSRLSEELELPFRAHLFITPPGRQGLQLHFDDQEVFVLQLAGAKHWTVHAQQVPVPRRSGVIDDSSQAGARACFRLEEGDCLYVPAGSPHQASAVDGAVSIHLSLGGAPLYWAAMIEAFVRRVLRTPDFAGTPASAGIRRDRYLKELSSKVQELGNKLRDLQTEDSLDDVVRDHWKWAVPEEGVMSVVGDLVVISGAQWGTAAIRLAPGAVVVTEVIDNGLGIAIGDCQLLVPDDFRSIIEILDCGAVPMTAVAAAVGEQRARAVVADLINKGAVQIASPE
jgi:hypothetical protein